MAALAVLTITQSAAEKSSLCKDKNFRHGDQGKSNVELIGFEIALNSGTALAGELKSKLMTLPVGAIVKEVAVMFDVVATGGNEACTVDIGYLSSNTDILASNDDHYVAALSGVSSTLKLPYSECPIAAPSTPSDATWFYNQAFPVPVDIELTVNSGYKSTVAVKGKVRIVWDS